MDKSTAYVSLQVRFRQEALSNLLEARFEKWEEDASNSDMITRDSQSCSFTTTKDSQTSRNVTNWNLVTLQILDSTD